MKRHYFIGGVVAAGILLVAGVTILLYGLAQGGTLPDLADVAPQAVTEINSTETPKIDITPPPSLVELAAEIRPEYPELADLLENPELGSVYKDFYLTYQQGGETAALALARQRGILNEADQIVMTLILDTEETGPLIAELEAEGIITEAVFQNKVNILIPVSLIKEQLQAEAPDLIVERISNLEHVIRLEFPKRATIKQRTVLGQGVNVTFANSWQAQGITGQGVKVGVLDLGFAGYEDLLGTELPDSVEVGIFGDDSDFDREVHGTACAEIVHEMAPDAEIVLAYYDGSDAAMGEAVAWLMQQRVDIISNSTGSNGLTPMDGTGLIAEMVDEVHDQGVFWVNAAGNEADAHYRGQFKDPDRNHFHDFFLPDTETIPFTPFEADIEVQIILSWDDWAKVDQDYELILYDESGDLLAKSEEPQSGEPGQYPIEGFLYTFDDIDTYFLSIENYDGQARGDATFDLFTTGASIEADYAVPEYSLSSPSDARGAFAVGAVHWADDILEFYSSQGPTTDGRIKPDLSAPSVVDSVSYESEAFNGTSAAAPHVSGAAALVLQAFPNFTPAEIATFFEERSIDLGTAGQDNTFGAGRLNLGASPNSPASPETSPAPVADVQPTSTPRPAEAAGLPGQTVGIEVESGASSQSDGLGEAIVLLGLCLICVAGLVAPLILGVGFVMMRRK